MLTKTGNVFVFFKRSGPNLHRFHVNQTSHDYISLPNRCYEVEVNIFTAFYNNIVYNNNGNNNDRKITNNGMFSCLFFNARSLSNKKQLGKLELILRSCNFNIVAVCETWLNKSSPDSLLGANGDYTVFRQHRVGRGGGTAFLFY